MWFDVDAALESVCGSHGEARSRNNNPTAANPANPANRQSHETHSLARLAGLAGPRLGNSDQHDAHVEDWIDHVERAAIIEFDGWVSRLEAEKRAGIRKSFC